MRNSETYLLNYNAAQMQVDCICFRSCIVVLWLENEEDENVILASIFDDGNHFSIILNFQVSYKIFRNSSF